MLFSHDTEHALACVVGLVNSAPSPGNDEMLPDPETLAEFVARHQVSGTTRPGRRDLAAVRGLRGRIRPVFGSADDAGAARIVNALVSRAPVTPRMTNHDGYPWHMHYSAPGASLADHLAVDCGMALAQVISAGERERLRRCEAPGCEQVLVDLSRNRSKRYCDARTCGNRLHVAAYRQRRRGTAAG